jgi:DNA-binding NarL/FixJ family response regulator
MRGTLLITRAVMNHAFYKNQLEDLGFNDVTVTALEKDALYSLIRELKPERLLMFANFYHCCTPFMMGLLHTDFPKIKMSAVSIGEYPDEIAMYFILNGIKSYITSFDGVDQFYEGLKEVAKGKVYVSPGVQKRIKLRQDEEPAAAGTITERHKEVLRLICCGFKDKEIAETLAISRNTVVNHKTNFFTSLNVRNPLELVRAALTLEIVRLEEIYFYPRDITLNPLPTRK